ncbi:MAG: hypothetical protein WC429_20385, partial [Verrucomicrobiia bacterium]
MRTLTRTLALTLFLCSVVALLAQQRTGKHSGDLRAPDTLRVSDAAPDFKLKTKDGSREVTP